MRVPLLLALLAASASLLSAAEQAPAPPQAPALPVARVQAPVTPWPCSCTDGGPCRCGENCPCVPVAKPPTYAQLRARAVREGRPLVVWVSIPDAHRRTGELPEALHHVCATFSGVAGTGVVVGLPQAGDLSRHDLGGVPATASLRAVLTGASPAVGSRAMSVQGEWPVPAAVFQPVYSVPAYPSFGGNFGGGGFANCGSRG
jgi:hypothetical protein